MESLYMSVVPSILSLRLQFYVQVSFIVLGLIIIGLLLGYWISKYKRRQEMFKELGYIKSQFTQLRRQILIKKIKNTDGKEMLIIFLEYLERFTIVGKYHSIDEILTKNGFGLDEIEKINKILYANAVLDQQLKAKILQFLN